MASQPVREEEQLQPEARRQVCDGAQERSEPVERPELVRQGQVVPLHHQPRQAPAHTQVTPRHAAVSLPPHGGRPSTLLSAPQRAGPAAPAT
jgi:hypothetical protein